MTIILLLISLMLNAGCIFAIILLYTRQNRLLELEQKQKKIIHEIEEVFSGYLLELKEENETFIKRMQRADVNGQFQEAMQENMQQLQDADSSMETRHEAPVIHKPHVSFKKVQTAYSNSGQGNTPADSGKPVLENELLTDRVVRLKTEGHTAEEIAKMLDKGKTEIELMLKFQKK
ncbi:hypothetical protein [Mesobacillus zeae]|uniref:Swarming motility protein SwrB n=1 Tax=Mesobacillus zeae TaxID=1917180 RepID=A0A398BCU0_9BACI|nr:hypothetical protein [Mesobacillus zeae]RID88019.1 hypothetical protein D1970_04080 [Mesobacillus zeae]